MHKIIVIFF